MPNHIQHVVVPGTFDPVTLGTWTSSTAPGTCFRR